LEGEREDEGEEERGITLRNKEGLCNMARNECKMKTKIVFTL
jgi:hypothetical protein